MRRHLRDILVFILLAASLMGLADYFFMEARHIKRGPDHSPYVSTEPAPVIAPETVPEIRVDPVIVLPEADEDDIFDFFNEDSWWEEEAADNTDALPLPVEQPSAPAVMETIPAVTPEIPLPEVPAIAKGVRPRIAIIIDDVGMNLPWSREAVNLPAAVTMAILPYAEQAAAFARQSKEKGHDVLIHTPMEAMNAPVSLGGMGLTTDMSEAEIIAMMELIALKMDGYIGINNHMGSKFTSDRAAMEKLMPYLKKRGLMFIDSKTIGHSVAANVAAEHGVPTAARDVFLDHEETAAFVRQALAQAERVAYHKGHAIAIGHPKAVTINGLKEWIPTLADKGIDLVPISALVRVRPAEKTPPVTPQPAAAKVVEEPSPAPETAPDLPRSEQLLLYSPSPETRY